MMEYSKVEAEMMTEFLKNNFPTKRIKSKSPNRVNKNWETVIILSNGDNFSIDNKERKEIVLNFLVCDLRKIFSTNTSNCYPVVQRFLNLD